MKSFGVITLNRKHLSSFIFLAILAAASRTDAVEFNTDILDASDRENIDLSRFSQAGYIMPGQYSLSIRLNDRAIADAEIAFYERRGDKDAAPFVQACLKEEHINKLGLRPEAVKQITWWGDERCADYSFLQGMMVRGDLAESALFIAIPQAWLEYQDESWLPPSRWEHGVTGFIADYNINTNVTKNHRSSQTQDASIMGTLGMNMGAWRLRGDYQGQYNHTTGGGSSHRNFDWSRIYAYRPIPSMMATMTVGEDYLSSNIFDSWRFVGSSIASDERMLPPKLRGYAPEVSGIARTNAKVVISQQGRILHETTVPAGPFRISELSSFVNGQLDVRVEEQDGSVQTFQVNTATVPYLTRPGQIRYKFAVGRPSNFDHHAEGQLFATGEISWGISNAWSLYGGSIASEDYQSLALGIGRDLNQFGTVSADITQSIANLPFESSRREGRSWRVSYSKRFDDYNSEVTFAGYRFSERDYMTMPEYLDARYRDGNRGNSKELYTITANKNFVDERLSGYITLSRQTYWDRESRDSYSISASKYFDIGSWRGMSATLSAARTEYNGRKDDTAYLSLSVPFGAGTLSYNGNWNNDRYTQSAGWYQRMDNGDNYRITAGSQSGKGTSTRGQASGYYQHNGALAEITANASWLQNDYTSLGLSLSGGLTATAHGAALHPGSTRGGTRMMVSTDGVSNVPISAHGRTNAFGIAVVSDMASYFRTITEIDVNRLPDDIETSGPPVSEAALTEGAIGLRKFNVLKGSKIVAVFGLPDGKHPPFGASVQNAKGTELGIISDGGLAWLGGVNPNERLTVSWSGAPQCETTIPRVLSAQQLLLPCQAMQ
ncbi:fimbria/pilus outer membrane usher protein [Citrobacter sp. Cb003]|uniref:fimbria/pilus outer membrane usher protein n=1 Tax=Citrobacter sp. Cb003 TaxID=2985005 RepID=UPI00257E63FD|nr:fimbria/pilus outer membrane usher protein [Citrobacter sp. Cb003]MDM3379290.1 fimbria/pilus outer membrane usher protein [Citrobacter sp. Cb003]